LHQQTDNNNKTHKMKKLLLLTATLFTVAFAANAQNASSTAQQTIQLTLSNVLEITFVGTGTNTGSTVSLPFTSVNSYINGVSSSSQQLMIRSNKSFNVTVQSNAANFTYAGTTNPAPTMPVNGVLAIKVPANATGGTIAAPFSSSSFTYLTSSAQALINNGSNGSAQTFDVQYKATPGFNYPAGTYTVDVVYTATQQ
jgi:hypothetical protein